MGIHLEVIIHIWGRKKKNLKFKPDLFLKKKSTRLIQQKNYYLIDA